MWVLMLGVVVFRGRRSWKMLMGSMRDWFSVRYGGYLAIVECHLSGNMLGASH